ncbi:MAG TPA: glycosyltransferase [Gemmatimonadaceae bacterium]|nr:glycosyltransferase [Gemmatimonadaceae bacterium]
MSGSNEEMLFGCLDSLHSTLKGSRYSWSVTVTCNDSGTGLAGRVRARYPDVTVMQNEKPLGFAANHNRVLRSSRARFVWLLGDDLVILPGAIQGVTEFMNRPGSSRVGVVSPKLQNPDGSLQPSTHRFPSMPEMLFGHSELPELLAGRRILKTFGHQARSGNGSSDFLKHDGPAEVDTLDGSCVALRMKAVRQVGPMVEAANTGGEETEWHRRFKEQGWKVVYFADASVIHYGSQTGRDRSRNLNPAYLKGALFFFKTGSSPVTYGLFCAMLTGISVMRAAYALAAGHTSGVNAAKRYAAVAWSGLRRA